MGGRPRPPPPVAMLLHPHPCGGRLSLSPEAGGLPDPALLRTWPALAATLAHLRSLMSRVSHVGGTGGPAAGPGGGPSLLEAHRFLWDRYRSIRKDITQTELAHKVCTSRGGSSWAACQCGCPACARAHTMRLPPARPLPRARCSPQGGDALAWVIAANEEMARFMILADAHLAHLDKVRDQAAPACACASLLQRRVACAARIHACARASSHAAWPHADQQRRQDGCVGVWRRRAALRPSPDV